MSNKIPYYFSEDEVGSVAYLIRLAIESEDEILKREAIIVAKAFNREAFNKLGINQND
jgi:hypothetical protein